MEETPSTSSSPNRTLMLVLSYLGILALVPLLVEKEDPEVQWHAKHGLIMLGSWLVLFVGLSIVNAMAMALPGLNLIVSILGCGVYPLLSLGILVVHIVAIIKAVQGERLTLPIITVYVSRWK